MAETKVKTALDIAREKATASAEKKVAALNKRAIGVLNETNPALIAAVMAALDAEDASGGKTRKQKLADRDVIAKRAIVASFASTTATMESSPSVDERHHG